MLKKYLMFKFRKLFKVFMPPWKIINYNLKIIPPPNCKQILDKGDNNG